MNYPKPTKEGHLKKYRNLLLGWSKRFFKLERSYLHYFEAQHAPEPIGSITRGEIEDVKECTQFAGKQNVFELHTKSGVIWYLQADSAEEMVAWMRVIMPNTNFASRQQDQTSPLRDGHVPVSHSPGTQPSWHSTPSPHSQQWPSPQGAEHYPAWQGAQGQYLPHQQGTPPMHSQHGQIAPQFDPRMFAAGGPLYDPRVHGTLPYSPPPPYTEDSHQAQPLPSKMGQ